MNPASSTIIMPSDHAADRHAATARQRAAGGVPWRVRSGHFEVLLVHRPRYDDWAWSKGKLDSGESWLGAAVREVAEETGLRVRLGLPLPTAHYPVSSGGTEAYKEVRYWAAQVVDGDGRLEHEIDAVRWVDPVRADEMLSYERDRAQLWATVHAHQLGLLDSWPLIVVRHTKARPRHDWDGPDPKRPLDDRGIKDAERLVEVLTAYDAQRVHTSPSTRCADTVAPFARARGITVKERAELSEEAHALDPTGAVRRLERVLRRGRPAVVCTHGPVLPDLQTVLLGRLDAGAAGAISGDAWSGTIREVGHEPGRVSRTPGAWAVATAGTEMADTVGSHLDKGDVLVCHVVGTGAEARVVAAERHTP